MKKISQLILSLALLLTVIIPTSARAQESTVTPSDMALNIINGLKTVESFSTTYDGQIVFEEDGEEGMVDYGGGFDLILTPALEFGFELSFEAEDEGQTETYEMLSYLVEDSIYSYLHDSTEDEPGQWQTISAAESLGLNPSEFSMYYQLIISMLEGTYRGIYIPSEVNQLVSEKTEIEETQNGYLITINSFESEEEWLAFFDALEELAEDASDEVEGQTGAAVTTEDSELEDIQEAAQALSENLTYTLEIEVDADYLIQTIVLTAEATAADASSEDTEIESFDFNFNLEASDYNNVSSIEVPAEALAN